VARFGSMRRSPVVAPAVAPNVAPVVSVARAMALFVVA
jgi:hypothetical protein